MHHVKKYFLSERDGGMEVEQMHQHVQTSSRPLALGENPARLAWVVADHLLFQTPWMYEICTWDFNSEQVLTASTRQQVKKHAGTFYDPVSRTPASGAVWCACAALCMYKVLICSLFTILPSRTDGSLCICTTCQLKWKCVASRHRVRIRNVPVEREAPPERHAGKLKSKVRYMNRWEERGRWDSCCSCL